MADEDRAHWDRRWGEAPPDKGDPPDWLAEFTGEFPAQGKALDVAAGMGRAALWLARAGLDVTALDVSPVGLGRLRESARDEGLEVETLVADLEVVALPRGPWQVVSCFAYLQRDLFPAIQDVLAPGGIFICEISTLRNLERHERPPARFLLEENELLRLCAPLSIVYYREGWIGDRARARVIARKPVPET
jgi:SAM-dependent methyltransferase